MFLKKWQDSLQRLRTGDYSVWPSHEFILSGKPGCAVPTPTFGYPIWDGSEKPITLLVNADFGMGDTIQFYRFIPEAQKRVKRLILRCDEDFKSLFPSVEVISVNDPPPEFDEIIHMMALPGVLGSEINGVPYLSPNYEEKFRDSFNVLDVMKFTKIGICWSGNPFNPRDRVRSIPVEMFKPWTDAGMKFFSLNKIVAPPEGFFDMRSYMSNWNQTAYLLTYFDLIISVDTAVAHLAGAMGAQTALLLPTTPDWRWKDEGSKTVWYDSMQIFRQKAEGDWSELLSRLWKLLHS